MTQHNFSQTTRVTLSQQQCLTCCITELLPHRTFIAMTQHLIPTDSSSDVAPGMVRRQTTASLSHMCLRISTMCGWLGKGWLEILSEVAGQRNVMRHR